MKKSLILLTVLMLGCQNQGADDQDTEELPPIGPGSRPSTLIPPDTPGTSRELRTPADTLRPSAAEDTSRR